MGTAFKTRFSGTCGICKGSFGAGAVIKRIKHIFHQTDRSTAWAHAACSKESN